MTAETEVHYYFAYGSNMLADRFLLSNQGTRKGVGTLKDYCLGFNLPLPEHWGGTVATVIKKKGASVQGVVWEIDETGIKTLDA